MLFSEILTKPKWLYPSVATVSPCLAAANRPSISAQIMGLVAIRIFREIFDAQFIVFLDPRFRGDDETGGLRHANNVYKYDK